MNFYFDAVNVLDQLDAKKGSIKGLLGRLPESNRKRIAALVIETLKFKPVLTEIIKASQLLQQERQHLKSLNLALLLVHDLLFAKGIQAKDGPIKIAIHRHKTRLHAELSKIKIKKGVKENMDLAQQGDPRASRIPRYVRVNTLRWTMEEALEHYQSKGFKLSGDPCQDRNAIAIDAHIPNLLLFHPLVQFHDDPHLHSGQIIMQDKASCFPAVVLAPPSTDDAHVIDATAAPGNKTSHLSALMGGRGKIFAFERDRRRFATLKSMLAKAHCSNVEAQNEDFLKTDPHDERFIRVAYILLDPSCSGSGIVNRLDHLLDTEENEADEERLQKLAAFQLTMIKHAMKFPAVKRIVYSTCSVHAIENEDVVEQALCCDEAHAGGFRLAPREEVLPAWRRRGSQEHLKSGDSGSLVRCSPDEDQTNGFFVSCFKRLSAQIEHGARNGTLKRSMEFGDESRSRDSAMRRKKRKRMK